MERNLVAPEDTCNGCGWSFLTSRQWLATRTSLNYLQQSAQLGCSRCSLLLKAVESFRDLWDHGGEAAVAVRCHPQGADGVGTRVLWPSKGGVTGRETWQQIGIEILPEVSFFPFLWSHKAVKTGADLLDLWQKRVGLAWFRFSHRQIPASTDDGSLDFLKKMIEDCLSSHAVCADPGPGMRNPTRLLRIVDDSAKERRVFLIATDPTKTYQYTALSHCWGSPEEAKKMPKTTRSNFLRQQGGGIPISQLTRTFQDSIQLTAQLGLEHIWIDSLCIIQGDAADWAIESVTMASVYGGAHLVIAATCGKDGNDGLYPPRNPVRHIKIPVAGEDPVEVSVMAFHPGDWNHQAWQFGTWTSSSDFNLPLHKRAWTFQERLLAKRIVHFTPLEMVWECWSLSSCECGELQWKRNREVYPGAKSKHQEALRNSGVDGRLRAWDDIMAGYSVRDITYYQDRVQAIAGVALQFDRAGSTYAITGLGRYLCGLWEADLPMGLLWYSLLIKPKEKHYKPHRRLRGWTVPTWSWLSVQGDISYQDREGIETPLAVLQDISYCASPDNPWGMPVHAPTLTIHGMTTEIQVKDLGSSADDPYYVVVHPSSDEDYRMEADIQVPEVPFQSWQIKALRISTQEEPDAMNCLVLCHLGSDTDQYERLGIASIDNGIFEEFGSEESIVML